MIIDEYKGKKVKKYDMDGEKEVITLTPTMHNNDYKGSVYISSIDETWNYTCHLWENMNGNDNFFEIIWNRYCVEHYNSFGDLKKQITKKVQEVNKRHIMNHYTNVRY